MATLDNNKVQELLGNATLCQEFPFLKAAKAGVQASQKGCCGRSAFDWNGVKRQIAELPAEARVRFKSLAGLAEVQVTYNRDGTITTVTL